MENKRTLSFPGYQPMHKHMQTHLHIHMHTLLDDSSVSKKKNGINVFLLNYHQFSRSECYFSFSDAFLWKYKLAGCDVIL